MSLKKTVFILPGYRQTPKQKAYQAIAAILKNEGYDPILVTVPWKESTISENTELFLQKFKKIQRKKKYILGFSFGAMIAFLAATKVDVEGLILCSLSPYFKEDLPKVKKNLLSPIQKERYEDFSSLHCATLAKQIKAKQVLMVYGSKEARPLKKRVTTAFTQIAKKQKYLLPVKHVDHTINDKRYLSTIHQIVQTLN
ncbi:hypothetical protein HZA75_04310 [Candidatus Roizmanbacteria bacterium]|nr:hypothetical protein [Candidatus Roizmanbacteria bacterium]